MVTDGQREAQIVHFSRRGSRTIEHPGSAHDETEMEALKAAAAQRLAGGQGQVDPGPRARMQGGGVLRSVLTI